MDFHGGKQLVSIDGECERGKLLAWIGFDGPIAAETALTNSVNGTVFLTTSLRQLFERFMIVVMMA